MAKKHNYRSTSVSLYPEDYETIQQLQDENPGVAFHFLVRAAVRHGLAAMLEDAGPILRAEHEAAKPIGRPRKATATTEEG